MPALGYWYTLIFFKNPVLALIYHTLIYHNACNALKYKNLQADFLVIIKGREVTHVDILMWICF